jgi:hypothetical protein
MANQRTKVNIMEATMTNVKNNENRFLATNNKRYNFFQRNITGCMDKETEQKLTKTANILSGFKDRCYIRSANISELRDAEKLIEKPIKLFQKP